MMSKGMGEPAVFVHISFTQRFLRSVWRQRLGQGGRKAQMILQKRQIASSGGAKQIENKLLVTSLATAQGKPA